MRLIAARLERVRQHRLLELRFDAGFTLIAGANETGKSTVVEALHKALFLKATATGRGVEELRSLTHGGLPEVELRFAAAGGEWLLRKRFAGSGGTCQLSSAEGGTLLGQAAETQLAALLQVSGPVEGRRIAQLPLRWAHLWVRQGEAGSDPLASGGEAYDLPALVQQLQQRGASDAALSATAAALESPHDRQVQQQLQQQRELQLTATGKVRAGSPLAQAQQRESEARTALSLGEQRLQQQWELQLTATGKVRAGSPLAQAQQRESEARTALSLGEQRLAELEAAMEELRQIGLRLAAIDEQERPALLHQGQLRNQIQLLQAEHEPLQQRQQQLQAAVQQLQGLQLQRQADQQQLQQIEQLLSQQQNQQQQLSTGLLTLQQQGASLEQQQQRLLVRQEIVGAQRDLAALAREEQQLRSHKSQFDALQQQAQGIKQQLDALPAIDPQQVRQLRQAEQALAHAQARCQGMATRLSLLRADQPVQLAGQPLQEGADQLLEQPTVLQIGAGTQLQISPGGGEAMGDARERRLQAEAQLRQLQTQLAQDSSEAADALAQRRQALESELANLRKAAQAIPWARLDAQLAELAPRRQRLLAALQRLGSEPAAADADADPSALDAEQDTLRATSQRLGQERAQIEQLRQSEQQQLEALARQQAQHQAEAARLSGGLAAAQQQLAQLQGQHGNAEQLAAALAQLDTQLQSSRSRIEAVQQQLGANPLAGGQAPAARLQQLEQEKDTLLTRRGQQEQLCRSLGAHDPVAAVEQLQAAWEQAQAERLRLEQRTAALNLVLEAFHRAQQQAASQYCLPLQAALQGYLDALGLPAAGAAQMGYDPQQGFGDLQLQQGNQSFAFAQLSGGMREQLAAALRLALAEVLQTGHNGCLPLVFDDAFSNSDPQRRQGVRRMLQRGVERGLQIVMFSCTPDDFAPLALQPGQRLALGAGGAEQGA